MRAKFMKKVGIYSALGIAGGMAVTGVSAEMPAQTATKAPQKVGAKQKVLSALARIRAIGKKKPSAATGEAPKETEAKLDEAQNKLSDELEQAKKALAESLSKKGEYAELLQKAYRDEAGKLAAVEELRTQSEQLKGDFRMLTAQADARMAMHQGEQIKGNSVVAQRLVNAEQASVKSQETQRMIVAEMDLAKQQLKEREVAQTQLSSTVEKMNQKQWWRISKLQQELKKHKEYEEAAPVVTDQANWMIIGTQEAEQATIPGIAGAPPPQSLRTQSEAMQAPATEALQSQGSVAVAGAPANVAQWQGAEQDAIATPSVVATNGDTPQHHLASARVQGSVPGAIIAPSTYTSTTKNETATSGSASQQHQALGRDQGVEPDAIATPMAGGFPAHSDTVAVPTNAAQGQGAESNAPPARSAIAANAIVEAVAEITAGDASKATAVISVIGSGDEMPQIAVAVRDAAVEQLGLATYAGARQEIARRLKPS
jgi:hypothetical protein